MAKMIHAMIRVLDLDRSMRFYRDAFGFETVALTQRHGATASSTSWGAMLFHEGEASFSSRHEISIVDRVGAGDSFTGALILNRGRTEPYTHGTGYGHVAVCVDDLAAEHARVKSLGLAPNDIKEFRDGDRLIARFFFMQDPDGYKIEVLQRHGHYA